MKPNSGKQMAKVINITECEDGEAYITITDRAASVSVEYNFDSLDDAIEALPNLDEVN